MWKKKNEAEAVQKSNLKKVRTMTEIQENNTLYVSIKPGDDSNYANIYLEIKKTIFEPYLRMASQKQIW